MIVVRFKLRCRPEKAEQLKVAFGEVIAASRPLEGVISFDIGQDLSEADTFIGVEVFDDKATLDRQESLPVTQRTIGLLGEAVVGDLEATIYHVSSSEPWG